MAGRAELLDALISSEFHGASAELSSTERPLRFEIAAVCVISDRGQRQGPRLCEVKAAHAVAGRSRMATSFNIQPYTAA